MSELEAIVTKYGHPIIRNRIRQLAQLLSISSKQRRLNITCFNIFCKNVEIVLDHDEFYYKIYFLDYEKLLNIDKEKQNLSHGVHSNYEQFSNCVDEMLGQDFTLVIEVYNKFIKQLWNDSLQLIEYYKSLINININIFEHGDEFNDYIKIKIPSKLISELNSNFPNIMKNSRYFAFEMLSSAIRNCLYCGSILNTIRYITYFRSHEEIIQNGEYRIENYSLVDLSQLSNKRLLVFYPNLPTTTSDVILVLELGKSFINQNIITNNFLQELTIAINQYEKDFSKEPGFCRRISIFFSSSLPKNIEEISCNKKLDHLSENNSFLIFLIPIIWLKSTSDSLKLFLSAFISIINDILYHVIPQCKCKIRCGLRKHVLELTNQEREGY